MTATEYVILVDANNNEIGQTEKLDAHKNNLLHRAFSIFIFRQLDQPELLIQQRALHKYHSPGLWTNTCCSHPGKGETVIAAGERRLQEELGLVTSLTDLGWFHYNARFSNGLSEHEIDHVLVGQISPDQAIAVNPNEVHAYRWVTLSALEQELAAHPALFTSWLDKALEIVKRSQIPGPRPHE